MEDFYDFCKYLILSPVNFLLDMHLTVKITPINIEQALSILYILLHRVL